MIRVAVFVLLLKSSLVFGDKATDHNANGFGHPAIGATPAQPQLVTDTQYARYRRNSKDLNFLRLYLCEAGYQNCMPDERY